MEKINPPYAVAALVLGICSLLFGCFFVGLVLGIVGIVLANKGLNAYRLTPEKYTGSGMLTAGRVMSIIGVVFGSIYVVYYIIAVAIIGTVGFSWLTLFNDLL